MKVAKNKEQSIVSNYLYNVAYEIFVLILPFITATYTSRIFGPDGIGIYSYSNTIASYAILIGSLGISTYGQRECSRFRNNKEILSKTFWELVFLKAISCSICLLIYLLPSFLSQQYGIYLQAFTILIIANIFDISWFFRGIESFKWVSIWQIISKIISIICLFTFIKAKTDLLLYIILISSSTFIGNIFMWITLKKYVCLFPIHKLKPLSHLKNTFIYFVPTISTSVYTQLDKLMIGWITNNDFQNGYYEQATKIISMCKTLILTINIVVSSRISYLYQLKRFDEIKKRIINTTSYIMLLSIPMVIGLIAVSKDFVPLFFGDGYDEVVYLIYILAPILFVVGISNVLGTCYFTPSGQRGKSNKIVVAGAALNFILNLIFIQFFEARGAAFASLIAETFILIFYLIMCRNILPLLEIIKMMWKKIIAAIIMIIFIMFIRNQIENLMVSLILQVVSGAIIYFAVLLLLKDNTIFNLLRRFFN